VPESLITSGSPIIGQFESALLKYDPARLVRRSPRSLEGQRAEKTSQQPTSGLIIEPTNGQTGGEHMSLSQPKIIRGRAAELVFDESEKSERFL
jgi:hypothetical protein